MSERAAAGTATTLEEQRDRLYARLDAGMDKIEAAGDHPDVAEWERLWHSLLRDYESVCRQLAAETAAKAGRGQAALFGTETGRRYQ